MIVGRRIRPPGRAARVGEGACVNRWLLLVLGLAVAAAGLFALAGGDSLLLPVASGPKPLEDIDADSRARLEQVLRDAEREERAQR